MQRTEQKPLSRSPLLHPPVLFFSLTEFSPQQQNRDEALLVEIEVAEEVVFAAGLPLLLHRWIVISCCISVSELIVMSLFETLARTQGEEDNKAGE